MIEVLPNGAIRPMRAPLVVERPAVVHKKKARPISFPPPAPRMSLTLASPPPSAAAFTTLAHPRVGGGAAGVAGVGVGSDMGRWSEGRAWRGKLETTDG